MKLAIGSLLVALTTGSAFADRTVSPNLTDNRGVWEGFGTSIAWFGNGVGQSSYQELYADLLFTTKSSTVLGHSVPGLGLTLARYNIGGCGQGDVIDGHVENQPPSSTLPWYKAIHGYWVNWFSTDPTTSSWDWTRDANQRSMMVAASQRGARIELFANAPMWWMTAQKSSCGGQLQSWNLNDFATYLATVAKKATSAWKVNLASIEAFNEPTAGWWNYPCGQEGCNISQSTQATILGYLRQELDSRGLKSVQIAASDENAMPQALSTYGYLGLNSTTVNGASVKAASLIDKLCVHSYNGLDAWTDNTVRTALHAAAGKKPVWSSEFGDPDGGGLTLAKTITSDINYLRSTAWHYWQAIEPSSGWGLINAQYGNASDQFSSQRGAPLWVYTKYYTFAQFTRFLRPGMIVLGTSDDNTVLGYDPAGRTLTFITVNAGPAQSINYDLSGLGHKNGMALVTTTNTDSSKVFVQTAKMVIKNTLSIPAGSNSITSTVVTGVYLPSLPGGTGAP